MNANFTAIQTAVNNIYPSQILPLTAGQATFGATAVGVGYKFIANDATAVPLTIAGFASQSVDIFDVTLTSGGTNAFKVDKNGLVTVADTVVFNNITGTAPSNSTVTIGNDIGATNGMQLNVPAGSTNGFTFNVNGALKSQITNTGTVISLNNVAATGAGAFSTPVGTGGSVFLAGDLAGQHSTSVGCMWVGGSVTSYTFDGGFNNAGKITLLKSGATLGSFDGTTGVYTPVSDAKLKENVAPIKGALTSVMALNPSSFTWIKRPFTVLSDAASNVEKSEHAVAAAAYESEAVVNDFGFIAQDVQAIFPEAVVILNGLGVADGEEPILGLNYQIITAHLLAAFQEYVAGHP